MSDENGSQTTETTEPLVIGRSPPTTPEAWGRPSWVPENDHTSINLLRLGKDGTYRTAWSIYGMNDGRNPDAMQQANAICRLLNEQFPTP